MVESRDSILCRILGPKYRRRILTVKTLKLANRKKKKKIDSRPVEKRPPRELYWISEDMAVIQQLDNVEEAMEIIAEKISTRKMKELALKEAGEVLESGRKRKIPYERTGEIPAILHLPRRVHRTQALKRACGRFPPMSTTQLEHRFGTKVEDHLTTLRTNLSKTFLDPGKTLATEKALDELNWFNIL